MTKEKFEEIMATYKKGTYIKMVWQTHTIHGSKLSRGVVRFTNLEVKVSKQGVEYVVARITKNKRLKANVTYFSRDGVNITKEEYEANNPTYVITDYFAKHLDDIVSLR